MFEALGLVEVNGSADAIVVADLLLKTADVEFQTWHTKCGGHATIFISGDVAAVKSAIDRAEAKSPCKIYKTAVISAPAEETERLVIESRESGRFARNKK